MNHEVALEKAEQIVRIHNLMQEQTEIIVNKGLKGKELTKAAGFVQILDKMHDGLCSELSSDGNQTELEQALKEEEI